MKKFNLSKKNKKRLLIILGSVVLILVVLFSIPKSTYESLFGLDKNIVEEPLEDTRPYQIVYVLSKNDEFVGLKVKVDSIEEDQIVQKWNLLTSKSSTYPLGYHTPIETSTILNDYEISNNQLTLSLSDDFLNSNGKTAIASIVWTFCSDEIEKIIIKVNDQKLSKLQDYSFNEINKDIYVNYIFETSYLFEANWTTVIFNMDDYYLPVTYFYKDIDELDFIASKLLSEEIVENDAFTTEIKDKKFYLNLKVDDVLTTDEIEQIVKTIKLNFDVDSLEINNNVMLVYQETFNESVISGSYNEPLEFEKAS